MAGNNVTDAVQQALQAAQVMATQWQSPYIEPCHLALSLLSDENGMANQVMGNAGLDSTDALKSCLERLCRKNPRQNPPPTEPAPSAALSSCITAAQAAQSKMGDAFLALDHLLLGLLADKAVLKELGNTGVTKASLEAAVTKARNNKKADSPSAESNYQALAKYGKNLCELALSGKLDPVIGRDEEIRRVTQVLARRMANFVQRSRSSSSGSSTYSTEEKARAAAQTSQWFRSTMRSWTYVPA